MTDDEIVQAFADIILANFDHMELEELMFGGDENV